MRHTLIALLLLPLSANAYELRRDSTGEIVRWGDEVEFVVDKDLANGLGDTKAFSAVQSAVENLALAAPGLKVSLRAGATSGVGYEFQASAKNQNEIVLPEQWPYDQNAIAVTVVTVDTRSHRIIDADIAFNITYRKFKVLSAKEAAALSGEHDDIQNTITHELGHALGLAHNPEDPEVVMFPSARRGETKKRYVSADDAAGLNALYPGGADAPVYTPTPQEMAMGCSSSAGGTQWLWMLLALPFLALGRRKAVAVTAVAVAAVVPTTGWASPSERADAAVRSASLAATATVVATRTILPTHGKLLLTELELELRECLKGACLQRMVVQVPGGRMGAIEQYVDGLSVPKEGEVVGVTVHQSPAQTARPPQVYRLEHMRDFSAFARGAHAAGLKPSLSLPGSLHTPASALTPAKSR